MPPKRIIPPEEHESFKDTTFAFGMDSDGKLEAMSREQWIEDQARIAAETDAMNAAIAEVYGPDLDLDALSVEELDQIINGLQDQAEDGDDSRLPFGVRSRKPASSTASAT